MLSFVVIATWQQRYDEHFWWIETRQYIYHDVVEDDVWHMFHDMLDKKYLDTFRMSFLAFEHLVLELIPFLQSHAHYFVRPHTNSETS